MEEPRNKVADALAAVEDVLLEGGGEAVHLWMILTGLRGPDDHLDQPAKMGTTAVIRSLAFPRLAQKAHSTAAWFPPGGALFAMPGTKPVIDRNVQSHFYQHVLAALTALARIGRG